MRCRMWPSWASEIPPLSRSASWTIDYIIWKPSARHSSMMLVSSAKLKKTISSISANYSQPAKRLDWQSTPRNVFWDIRQSSSWVALWMEAASQSQTKESKRLRKSKCPTHWAIYLRTGLSTFLYLVVEIWDWITDTSSSGSVQNLFPELSLWYSHLSRLQCCEICLWIHLALKHSVAHFFTALRIHDDDYNNNSWTSKMFIHTYMWTLKVPMYTRQVTSYSMMSLLDRVPAWRESIFNLRYVHIDVKDAGTACRTTCRKSGTQRYICVDFLLRNQGYRLANLAKSG